MKNITTVVDLVFIVLVLMFLAVVFVGKWAVLGILIKFGITLF